MKTLNIIGIVVLCGLAYIYLKGKIRISSIHAPEFYTDIPLKNISNKEGSESSFLMQLINVKLLLN